MNWIPEHDRATLTRTERELAQDSVDTVGRIFSNYQAGLHLLEEAVAAGYGDTVSRAPALDVLRHAAQDVFTPVLHACAGVTPGLESLVEESAGELDGASARAPRDLVSAERARVAATHSRLIRRSPAFMDAAEQRAAVDVHGYRSALLAASDRLTELETGSHSAGALFRLLSDRWHD